SHFPTAPTTALSRLLQWNLKPWELHYDWTKNGGQVNRIHPDDRTETRDKILSAMAALLFAVV
ncbi:MAG: hypothetical protein ACREQ5_06005, partial [Candidatus Dormibacteria bacterium]